MPFSCREHCRSTPSTLPCHRGWSSQRLMMVGGQSDHPFSRSFAPLNEWTFNVNWSVRCRFQSHQSLSIMLSTLAHVHSHSITLPHCCYRSFPTNNQLHSYLTNIWKIEFKMEFPKWNIWFLKFSKSWNRIPEQKKFITLVPLDIKGSYLVYGKVPSIPTYGQYYVHIIIPPGYIWIYLTILQKNSLGPYRLILRADTWYTYTHPWSEYIFHSLSLYNPRVS